MGSKKDIQVLPILLTLILLVASSYGIKRSLYGHPADKNKNSGNTSASFLPEKPKRVSPVQVVTVRINQKKALQGRYLLPGPQRRPAAAHDQTPKRVLSLHQPARRIAPLAINPTRVNPLPAPTGSLVYEDPDDDLSDVYDDLEFEEQRANEFLKLKAGLTEDQIRILHRKRLDYITKLQRLNEQQQNGSPTAATAKKNLINSHIQWMSQFLGPDHYQDYLELTSR